ncbi:MAG: flagellar biosynthetic protein FliR [Rhodospirillales bacterium]
MLDQILSYNIFGFFLIFARIGTAMMLLPGFSAAYVSAWIRLAVAVSLTLVVSPVLMPAMPVPPATSAEQVLLVINEVVVGGFLGLLARIAVGALQTAGTVISMVSALANALIQDAVAEQQSSIVSSFLSTTGVVLVFVTDMHHLMIMAIVESYALFVPAIAPDLGDIALMLARNVTESFALGLQISAPFIIVGLVYYSLLGIFGRLMPVLPVFFFAMPAQITMQFGLMMIILSSMMMVFLRHFGDTFTPFLNP